MTLPFQLTLMNLIAVVPSLNNENPESLITVVFDHHV